MLKSTGPFIEPRPRQGTHCLRENESSYEQSKPVVVFIQFTHTRMTDTDEKLLVASGEPIKLIMPSKSL